MIIGNGMLAMEFESYKYNSDILIFASGVSDSKETRISEFNREKELLVESINKNKDKKLVYFSTCSMYDTYFEKNHYTNHKLEMENLISTSCSNYNIFRLSQVVGKNNKNQLLGFLNDKIQHNENFTLYDIERNLIDISDVKKIIDLLLMRENFKNQIINIANKNNIFVIRLVEKLETILYRKANYRIVNKNGDFIIDTHQISNELEILDINNNSYIDKILRKYYE